MIAIPKLDAPSVAIAGRAYRFPVRRIYCVGQNYAEHAREMGADPEREPPFFFGKPADAVLDTGSELPFPPRTEALHHEVELVVALAAGGRDIAPETAESLIFGSAVGFDLTRRDLQAAAKKAGRPWDLGKGFDGSAPVGPLREGAPPTEGIISLTVNGGLRQRGSLSDMIWPVADIISFLSRYVALAGGDLLFTGTPAGVGPVKAGDRLRGDICGLEPLELEILPPR